MASQVVATYLWVLCKGVSLPRVGIRKAGDPVHLTVSTVEKTTGVSCTVNAGLIARGRCGLASRSGGLRRCVFARLGVVVEARLAVRFSEAKYIWALIRWGRGGRVRSTEFGGVLSSEVSMYIMGSSIGGSGTVRSRGGVRAREGPLSEVSLYQYSFTLPAHKTENEVFSFLWLLLECGIINIILL